MKAGVSVTKGINANVNILQTKVTLGTNARKIRQLTKYGINTNKIIYSLINRLQ
jgi:hypothetical protein